MKRERDKRVVIYDGEKVVSERACSGFAMMLFDVVNDEGKECDAVTMVQNCSLQQISSVMLHDNPFKEAHELLADVETIKMPRRLGRELTKLLKSMKPKE